jgi:hypothetical protein
MADIPKEVQDALRPHLAAIARIFKAPRITLIVRAPEGANVKGDLVLGNDDPSLALAALRARMVAEAELFRDDPDLHMKLQIKEPTNAGLPARGFQDGGFHLQTVPRGRRPG